MWTRSLNFHGKPYLFFVPPLRLLGNSSVNIMSTLQFAWECPTVTSCLFAPVIIRPLPVTHRRCGPNNPQQVFNSTGEKHSPVMLHWCVRNAGWESKRRETSLRELRFYYHCVQGSMCLLSHLFIFFLQVLLDSHLLQGIGRDRAAQEVSVTLTEPATLPLLHPFLPGLPFMCCLPACSACGPLLKRSTEVFWP